MPATYKDIQRMTGFSLSTISKYFNRGNVRPGTKSAIEAAVNQLDFRINDFARGLKSRKSMAVGLLIPELNGIFHTTIMRDVGQLLRRHGYSCLVCDSNADKNAESDALNFLIDKMVDGIITIPLNASGIHLETARARNIPVVLVDRKTTVFKADTVIIDNFSAGKKAAEYILDRGHTRAAVISGPSDVYTMKERCKGFTDSFASRGDCIPVRVIKSDFTIEGGYRAAKRLLTARDGVTAVFCANYELTLGTITAMNELGLRFPGDISVIGFDNMEFTRVLSPSITLIEQPMKQLARLAADLLLRRMEDSEGREYETVTLEANLIEGGSVNNLLL